MSGVPWWWWYVNVTDYDILAVLVVVAVLLGYSSRGGLRRPSPWVLGIVVVSMAAAYGLLSRTSWLSEIIGFRVPLSTYELVLPVLLLSTVALVGNDPRPGIVAATYALVHLALPVLHAAAVITHGGSVTSFFPSAVPILLLGLGLVATAIIAGTISGGRLASEPS